MRLLIIVCKKFKRTPAQVFRCAYQYYEKMIGPKKIEKKFYSCCAVDMAGKAYVVHVPKTVENFCLDLLAKRTTLPIRKEILTMK